MKYDESDIIDVWSDKLDYKEHYFFGNDKEELLRRANNPESESYRYDDITEDIFYVPDFETRIYERNGKSYYTEKCYAYAIPVEKPFVPRKRFDVPVRISVEGIVKRDTWQKTEEEAVETVLSNMRQELALRYPDCKITVKREA